MPELTSANVGPIITFEKSCEVLLDLYVNNRLYCRGEAVKIGEKFGIQICEVGSTDERVGAVLAVD
jgi:flagellar motor switch protein FliN/FliY